jgi:YHS domain-containing protein
MRAVLGTTEHGPPARGARDLAPRLFSRHLKETNMVKDPVCGMQVDEKKAGATSVHKGTTHHFCSPACKTKFDTTPEKFTGKGATPAGK